MKINTVMSESNVFTYVLARVLNRSRYSMFKGRFRKKKKMTTSTSLTESMHLLTLPKL